MLPRSGTWRHLVDRVLVRDAADHHALALAQDHLGLAPALEQRRVAQDRAAEVRLVVVELHLHADLVDALLADHVGGDAQLEERVLELHVGAAEAGLAHERYLEAARDDRLGVLDGDDVGRRDLLGLARRLQGLDGEVDVEVAADDPEEGAERGVRGGEQRADREVHEVAPGREPGGRADGQEVRAREVRVAAEAAGRRDHGGAVGGRPGREAAAHDGRASARRGRARRRRRPTGRRSAPAPSGS